jgi:hypothetical protein
MPDRSKTRSRDFRQLAKSIGDVASGERDDVLELSEKNLAAVPLGRLGGLKGRAARANSLLSKQRSDIARKAAQARYGEKS